MSLSQWLSGKKIKKRNLEVDSDKEKVDENLLLVSTGNSCTDKTRDRVTLLDTLSTDILSPNQTENGPPSEKFKSQGALPKQYIGNKTLSYQEKWKKQFPWIVEKAGVGVLCSTCVNSGLNFSNKNVFYSKGFASWNKAIEKFQNHEKSQDHIDAISNLIYKKRSTPIENQLITQLESEQKKARQCLLSICSAIKFLARQNVALRGHSDDEGNFIQLLNLLKQKDKNLVEWMSQENKKKWLSWEVQNEIIDILSSEILKIICDEIRQATCIGTIVDGTQDISGDDQLSICVRFVDKNFVMREELLGFSVIKTSSGAEIAKSLLEKLNNLDLTLDRLRWQTYDGAPNMSGLYNGTQSHIKKEQPLADYIHCTVHAINLVAQDVVSSSLLASSAMDTVNELGSLISRSGKLKAILVDLAIETDETFTSIKSLCQTRFLARVAPCKAVTNQIEIVLDGLEKIKNDNPTASGIIKRLSEGNTILGLLMTINVFSHLEILNKTLQGNYATVSGAIEATKFVIDNLLKHREDDVFKKNFTKAEELITDCDLEKISLPRQRCPSKRLTGQAEAHRDISAFEFFKRQYFAMIDDSIAGLKDKIFQPGMENLKNLENMLLTGKISETVKKYPEFDYDSLECQLKLFQQNFRYKSLREPRDQYLLAAKEVQETLHQVELLIRLLMTCPASSCEAERSFSALRRLKSWLRSTMKQKRLNGLAVCHVHKHVLDTLNLAKICNIYIGKKDSRQIKFGKFIETEIFSHEPEQTKKIQ